MGQRLPTLLRVFLLYPVAFLLFFVVGLYWTFPYDHLRAYLMEQVERTGRAHLSIGSLSPSWITGVHVEDVRYSLVRGGDSTPPVIVREADARISVLGLILSTMDVTFDARVAGGRVEGRVADGGGETTIQVQAQNVELGRIGVLEAALSLPVQGRLRADIDLTVADETEDGSGRATVQIGELVVADGETPLQARGMPGGASLTLEPIDLGDLEIRMNAAGGVGELAQFEAEGPDGRVRATGSLRLARPLPRSTMDVLVRVQFEDRYRTSSPRMEGLFMLIDSAPQVAQARTEEGALQWRLTGSPSGSVRMVPSGNVPMP
jgi:type II secretion system protein N